MHHTIPEAWTRLQRSIGAESGNEYRLEVGQYGNARLAVTVWLRTPGEPEVPYCKLTVNLPDEPCGVDQFFVKLGGAEERIAHLLEQLGIIAQACVVAGDGVVVSAGQVARYARLWEVRDAG